MITNLIELKVIGRNRYKVVVLILGLMFQHHRYHQTACNGNIALTISGDVTNDRQPGQLIRHLFERNGCAGTGLSSNQLRSMTLSMLPVAPCGFDVTRNALFSFLLLFFTIVKYLNKMISLHFSRGKPTHFIRHYHIEERKARGSIYYQFD
jgi:hypothetical protein